MGKPLTGRNHVRHRDGKIKHVGDHKYPERPCAGAAKSGAEPESHKLRDQNKRENAQWQKGEKRKLRAFEINSPQAFFFSFSVDFESWEFERRPAFYGSVASFKRPEAFSSGSFAGHAFLCGRDGSFRRSGALFDAAFYFSPFSSRFFSVVGLGAFRFCPPRAGDPELFYLAIFPRRDLGPQAFFSL